MEGRSRVHGQKSNRQNGGFPKSAGHTAARSNNYGGGNQSAQNLRDIAEMGLRWGVHPDVDEQFSSLVGDIDTLLDRLGQDRRASMEDIGSQFGIDFCNDDYSAPAYTDMSAPDRWQQGNRDPAGQQIESDGARHPAALDPLLVQMFSSLLQQQAAGEDISGMPQQSYMQPPGPSTLQPQFDYGLNPSMTSAAPAEDLDLQDRMQHLLQAQQVIQSRLQRGADVGASRSRPAPSAMYAYNEEPEDYDTTETYTGHRGGTMDGDVMYAHDAQRNSAPSTSSHQAADGRGSEATDRLSWKQMTASSGYVVKNTFIEPAEAADNSQPSRASAIQFRSEHILTRKRRGFNDDIFEPTAEEDTPQADEAFGEISGGQHLSY